MSEFLTSNEELKSWMNIGLFTSLLLKKLKDEQPQLLEDVENRADIIMDKLEKSGMMRMVAATVMRENLTYGGKKGDLLEYIQKMCPQALE